MDTPRALALFFVAVSAFVSSPVGAQTTPPPYIDEWDDFRTGFSVGSPDSRWFYFSAGPYVGDDGVITTGHQGLRVSSSGTNPTTGKPAFVRTLGQEGSADNPLSLPGGLDHVKWLAYMNHTASSGFPGFDLVPGQRFACSAIVGGRTFGTKNHPFGNSVAKDDLRLASVAMNALDFESFIVSDFFLTNEGLYALYERLPFGRGPELGNYAAFTSLVRVADRDPDDWHLLSVEYDRAAGTIRWLVNLHEVRRVDNIGFRPPRDTITLDHGGVETLVSPRQTDCGMGMFSLLDAYRPNNTGLVKLSNTPNFYFNPDIGEPAPSPFLDTLSPVSKRLFGQGSELKVLRFWVSSLPAPPH